MRRQKTKSYKFKIKSPLALSRLLKRQKKSSVFTNGCFDILHSGHVDYLESARKQGDFLIVALNSDSSIQTIKGPSRPINSLQDRLKVIAALESVDFVTWFEEDNPLNLILLLKPKVLVKGGDWKVEQIIGSKEVLAWGGKVRSLKYIEGKSTTQIIHRAKTRQA